MNTSEITSNRSQPCLFLNLSHFKRFGSLCRTIPSAVILHKLQEIVCRIQKALKSWTVCVSGRGGKKLNMAEFHYSQFPSDHHTGAVLLQEKHL